MKDEHDHHGGLQADLRMMMQRNLQRRQALSWLLAGLRRTILPCRRRGPRSPLPRGEGQGEGLTLDIGLAANRLTSSSARFETASRQGRINWTNEAGRWCAYPTRARLTAADA